MNTGDLQGVQTRGRFAPSPTGNLHLGNAAVALAAWLAARAARGEFLLRVEDLDRLRCRPQYVEELLRDLEYLGLHWDGEVLFQSQRTELYRDAIRHLSELGRVYPCFCSRADIARAASAPHGLSEEGPRYPGTCSHLSAQEVRVKVNAQTAYALRFKPGAEVEFEDLIQGNTRQHVARDVGDFVVQSKDGTASYQLAVTVDDALTGVTQVIRGGDLLSSTPRQIQLFECLGHSPPSYAHVPLVLGEDGKRLAKREGAFAVSSLRRAKVEPAKVIGFLAKLIGLSGGEATELDALKESFSLKRIRPSPARVTERSIIQALGLG